MSTRYQQPQLGIQIDWSNPITKGLVAALGVSFAELRSGSVWLSSNSPKYNAITRGSALTFSSGSSQYASFPLTSSIVGAENISMFCLYRPAVTTAHSVMSFGTASGTARAVLFCGNNGTTFSAGSDLGSGAASATITAGKTYAVGLVKTGSNAFNIFVDGVKTSGTVITSTGTFTHAYLGARMNSTIGSFATGDIILPLFWNRDLSDAEVKSLTDNPWQIFKPSVSVALLKSSVAGPAQYTLTAQGGSYTKSGASATLLKSKLITAQGGSYAQIGASATLKYNRLLTAQGGSYAKSGADAILLRNKNLSVQGGSYAKTGSNVNITYTGLANSYTLTCQGGVYTKSGSNATILKSKLLVAAGGTYTFTGRPVVITYSGAPPTSGLLPYLNVLNGEFCLFKPLN